MKKLYFALTAILILNNAHATQVRNDEWEQFGEWEVKPVHGEMDPYTSIIIRTKFNEIIDPANPPLSHKPEELVFGFKVFGGKLMSVYTMLNFGGRDYWPDCDYNSASFRVDNSKPHYISTIDNPGGCDRVAMNGKTVSMFKSGKSAKLKVYYRTGEISLNGFSAAYNRALQLSRR